MADDPEAELRRLIDEVHEIEKVAEEVKAARAENREPSTAVHAILDRWERDHIADESDQWLDEQEPEPGPSRPHSHRHTPRWCCR
jgi:hypothetical protein